MKIRGIEFWGMLNFELSAFILYVRKEHDIRHCTKQQLWECIQITNLQAYRKKKKFSNIYVGITCINNSLLIGCCASQQLWYKYQLTLKKPKHSRPSLVVIIVSICYNNHNKMSGLWMLVTFISFHLGCLQAYWEQYLNTKKLKSILQMTFCYHIDHQYITASHVYSHYIYLPSCFI